jgi:hypothetical protein
VQLCFAGSNALKFGLLDRTPPLQTEFTDALNEHLRAAITRALPQPNKGIYTAQMFSYHF